MQNRAVSSFLVLHFGQNIFPLHFPSILAEQRQQFQRANVAVKILALSMNNLRLLPSTLTE